MMKFLGKIFGITVLLVFLVSAQVLGQTEKKMVGTTAPDFTLKDLDGKKISLHDYKGRVILINFWGTWCKPCWKENQELLRVREMYKKKGLEVLGIVFLSPEPSVKYTRETLKLTYPILWSTDEVLKAYGITRTSEIPRTFLVDQEGTIREDIIGPKDFSFFEERVKKYLK